MRLLLFIISFHSLFSLYILSIVLTAIANRQLVIHIEVTKGCKIYKAFVRYLSAMRRERTLSCHTWWDTGPRFCGFVPWTAIFRQERVGGGWWGPILSRIPTQMLLNYTIRLWNTIVSLEKWCNEKSIIFFQCLKKSFPSNHGWCLDFAWCIIVHQCLNKYLIVIHCASLWPKIQVSLEIRKAATVFISNNET